jgi:tetratricopeptide (TPR) repeat protein
MNILNRIFKSPEDRAREHYRQGRGYMKQQRWKDAEQELMAAVEITPNYKAAWYALGFVHRKQGAFDNAIVAYVAALEIDPNCEQTQRELTKLCHQPGKLDDAIEVLEHGQELGVPAAGRILRQLQPLRDSELEQEDELEEDRATHSLSEHVRQRDAKREQRRPTTATVPEKLTREDVIRLYNEGERDFRKQKLDRINLSDADLRGADFSGADLSRANLQRIDLTGARLIGAKLYGAYMRNAVLRGAKLNGAWLQNADLGWADLSMAQLYRADLGGSKLNGARVTDQQLRRAASLRGAVLPSGRRQR